MKYFAMSNDDANNELYGIVDKDGNWVVHPVLPDFIAICALQERMNLCDGIAAGTVKLTVPVMARLGISPEAYERFHVYS